METNNAQPLACLLTDGELQKRKTGALASLKNQIAEVKELSDGFAFSFNGRNEVIDELLEFIKSERQCCPFFTFDISIKDAGSPVWLRITGPAAVKEFISSETGLSLKQ